MLTLAVQNVRFFLKDVIEKCSRVDKKSDKSANSLEEHCPLFFNPVTWRKNFGTEILNRYSSTSD